MKILPFLVLLSSAVLLYSADPGTDPVTCTQEGIAAAAHLATFTINEHHHHGYKFRLNETERSKLETVGDGCNIELQLKLLETKCSFLNPKKFESCPLREMHAREVKANCNSTITVKNGEDSVIKYACDTRQVITNTGMMSICPDCVTLLPLNDTEGVKSVNEAVKKFNENTTNTHYYVLKEVGRISLGHIMGTEMIYNAEFALVETHCPMGSRIMPEACVPVCPDRAHHAFCKSSHSSTKGLASVECEIYPPLNTTALAPGEAALGCRFLHHHHHHHSGPHGHGPPPHGRGHGPPPHGHGPPHAHDKDHGPPPHGHGPPHAHDKNQGPPPHGHGPPHAHDRDQRPPPHGHEHGHGPPPGHDRRHHHKHMQPCHGFLTYVDPALHPICPWPFPEHHHKSKPDKS